MKARIASASDRIKSLIDERRNTLRNTGGEGVAIGLLGRSIQASRSPAMHEGEGARQGLRYTYTLVDFDTLGLEDEDLGEMIELAEGLGLAGLNVTHPFKQAVAPHLTAVVPEAEAIGAVNTVVMRVGQRIGHNTDAWGFGQSLEKGLPGASMRSVVLFGAGGAGAAVAYSVLASGADLLTIFDPQGGKAADLARRMGERFARPVTTISSVESAPMSATGLINASPVGMDKYPGLPFPEALLQPQRWVAEVVYFPPITALVRLAGAAGCRVLTGTGMAVYQAVRAFELFTGRKADVISMSQYFHAVPPVVS